jgi:hypothetical protein
MARIARQPERLSAGLDTKGITDAVKQVREIDSTARVYKKTWMTYGRFDSPEAAKAEFAEKYEGRVTDDDHDIYASDNGRDFLLKLRVWNVVSEWNNLDRAQKFVEDLPEDGAEYEIVTRNSKREHELKAYGINKLPAVKA